MVTFSKANSGKEGTERRIVNAALTLFGQKGYSRTTTRAIAAKAEVNEVTIFRHFGNKKNLLMACVEAFNQGGFAATFEQHLTGEYAADIAIMARLQMTDMIRGFEALRLLMCDAAEVPEIRQLLVDGARSNQRFLVDYFQRQIEAGVIREEYDPLALANAFDSLFSSTLFFQAIFHSDPLPELPREAVFIQYTDLFVLGTVQRPEKE